MPLIHRTTSSAWSTTTSPLRRRRATFPPVTPWPPWRASITLAPTGGNESDHTRGSSRDRPPRLAWARDDPGGRSHRSRAGRRRVRRDVRAHQLTRSPRPGLRRQGHARRGDGRGHRDPRGLITRNPRGLLTGTEGAAPGIRTRARQVGISAYTPVAPDPCGRLVHRTPLSRRYPARRQCDVSGTIWEPKRRATLPRRKHLQNAEFVGSRRGEWQHKSGTRVVDRPCHAGVQESRAEYCLTISQTLSAARTPAEHRYAFPGSSLSFGVRGRGLFVRPGGTGGEWLPSLAVTRNEGVAVRIRPSALQDLQVFWLRDQVAWGARGYETGNGRFAEPLSRT